MSALVVSSDVVELIAASDRPLLLEFGADWCPPCHAIEPILAEIAEEHRDAIDVRTVDVDRVPDLVVRWSIVSAPTLLLFVEGEPVLRLVGARPKAALLEALAPFLRPTGVGLC
ncbi:MAG: thioredoxin domain-containing protein [Acidimicrobiales bacterium]